MSQPTDSARVLPATTTLGPASLIVADLERAVAFYRDILGFHVLQRAGDAATLGADEDTQPLVELTALAGARPKPRRTTGLYHVAILTPSRGALARSLYHLATSRYPLQGASDHLVSEALYLADPDGNGLEIYRDRPRSGWYDPAGQLQMSTLPLDLDTLLEEGAGATRERPWSGLDAGTRVGHVHLQVADLASAVRFYTEGLGFETMFNMEEMGAAFVSAGGYHHHIGLNTWTSRGAPPPPPGAAGLRVFEIVVPDTKTLAEVAARLTTLDIVFETVERAIEARDPSGNLARLVTAS
jgi:catechol 2,3-dioxygenase